MVKTIRTLLNKLIPTILLLALAFPSTSFGIDITGTYRFRAEAEKNKNGSTAADKYTNSPFDTFMLSQVRVNLKHALSDQTKVKFTLQDARKLGAVAPGNDDEGLGVYEAYLYHQASNYLGLKLGRQTLKYGKQRLISPLGWSNQGRSFEGAKGILNLGQAGQLDLFYMVTSENSVDDDEDIFKGAYLANKNPLVDFDLYYLQLDQTDDAKRNTAGVRLEKKIQNLQLDSEYILQTGKTSSTVDVDANAWAVRANYELGGSQGWAVRAEVNQASGDQSDTTDDEGFNHLFPLAHAYNGYMDIHLSWTNLRHYQVGIGAKNLGGGIGAWVDLHQFQKLEVTSGESDEYGREIDVVLKKKFADFTVKGGGSVYLPGDARTDFDDIASWAWIQLSATF